MHEKKTYEIRAFGNDALLDRVEAEDDLDALNVYAEKCGFAPYARPLAQGEVEDEMAEEIRPFLYKRENVNTSVVTYEERYEGRWVAIMTNYSIYPVEIPPAGGRFFVTWLDQSDERVGQDAEGWYVVDRERPYSARPVGPYGTVEKADRVAVELAEESFSSRTILIHLNCEVPAGDRRSADEIADALLGALPVPSDASPLNGVEICAPLAEEI